VAWAARWEAWEDPVESPATLPRFNPPPQWGRESDASGFRALLIFGLQWLTHESLTGEEKGDWLAALFVASAPPIWLSGRVPVPFFRSQHECDPL
jgi:hypothetical protein